MKLTKTEDVRVRFAPSPTGYLHVGGLRTALYNYLFARKHNGVFVLRVEDTDRTRYVEGAVDNLISTLKWAGLDYDEGPQKGGYAGPYIQSERLDIYRQYAEKLLNAGKAYRCFCTPGRLDEMRKSLENLKQFPKYDRACLKLTQAEVDNKITDGIPHVIRMKIPDGISIKFHDLIKADVEISTYILDDQVLMKSDGYPTYHLANVIDDHLMGITHIIRGDEWLPSVPKHILLYKYFGWEVPKLAHLPLLLNPDKSKLSKRQGDVAVEDYRAKGYLKEALINFVAFLGWNPGTEQEFFTMDDLINQFTLESVNKSGAVFNVDKLKWLNFEHLRMKPDSEVLQMLKEELMQSKYKEYPFDDKFLLGVIDAMRPRMTFVKDCIENSPYFFEPPAEYDIEVIKKRWKEDTPSQLKSLLDTYANLKNPNKEDYETALHRTAESLNIGNGKLIHAVRLAVSGVGGGPGLYDILYLLGKDESIKRIKTALENIKPL
jgi:glutamyl-tRNA synthetase